MDDHSTRPVVDERLTVAGSPDEVWRAVVDDRARAGWWGYLSLDARVGGQFEERWSDEHGRPVRTHGRVLEMRPQRLLRLTWRDEGWTDATEVELRLDAVDAGTAVAVKHTGWERLPDGVDLAEDHRAGWKSHLEHLRDYVENHRRAAHPPET